MAIKHKLIRAAVISADKAFNWKQARNSILTNSSIITHNLVSQFLVFKDTVRFSSDSLLNLAMTDDFWFCQAQSVNLVYQWQFIYNIYKSHKLVL